jgi:hypothetical protein
VLASPAGVADQRRRHARPGSLAGSGDGRRGQDGVPRQPGVQPRLAEQHAHDLLVDGEVTREQRRFELAGIGEQADDARPDERAVGGQARPRRQLRLGARTQQA